MKMLQRFCVALTVVLAGSALAFAQDTAPTAPGAGADQPAAGQRGQRGQRGGAAGQPGGPGGMRGQQPAMSVEQAVRTLTLTAEQQKQVEQVLTTYRQDLQKFNTDNAADIQAAREAQRTARQGGDAEAVKAAQEKQKAIDDKRKPVEDSLRKQLAGVLTREQMVKVDRLTGPAGAFDRLVEATKKLDLTADQQGKLTDIVKTADAEAKVKTADAEKATVYQDASTKVRELLTEEQRTKLQQVQRQAQMADMFRGLNTTPEQDKKIQEILDAAAADAGNRQAMRDAMTKITEEVLTPEQRTQMQNRGPAGMRGGPGAGGPGAGGNAAPGGRGNRGNRGGNAPAAPAE